MPTVGRTADHLARIADALGCSVADFGGAAARVRLDRLGELIRLWDTIDAQGCERVLACARAVAAEQDATATADRAAE